MNGRFVKSKEELYGVLYHIFRSGIGYIGKSKLYLGYRFWNINGNENDIEFPVIYWSESIGEEIIAEHNDVVK